MSNDLRLRILANLEIYEKLLNCPRIQLFQMKTLSQYLVHDYTSLFALRHFKMIPHRDCNYRLYISHLCNYIFLAEI